MSGGSADLEVRVPRGHGSVTGPWNSFENAGLIRMVDVPVLSIHGTTDEIVPFEQGQALFDLAPRGARFIAVEGVRH